MHDDAIGTCLGVQRERPYHQAYFSYSNNCVYTFPEPYVAGITKLMASGAPEESHSGYQLSWTSDQPCLADYTKKFTYRLNVLCDAVADYDLSQGAEMPDFTWEGTSFAMDPDACGYSATRRGIEGCSPGDIEVIAEAFYHGFAYLQIAVGVFLVFFGSHFVSLTFGILVFAAVAGVLLSALY